MISSFNYLTVHNSSPIFSTPPAPGQRALRAETKRSLQLSRLPHSLPAQFLLSSKSRVEIREILLSKSQWYHGSVSVNKIWRDSLSVTDLFSVHSLSDIKSSTSPGQQTHRSSSIKYKVYIKYKVQWYPQSLTERGWELSSCILVLTADNWYRSSLYWESSVANFVPGLALLKSARATPIGWALFSWANF